MVAGTNDSIDGYEFCRGMVPDTFYFPQKMRINSYSEQCQKQFHRREEGRVCKTSGQALS